MVKDTGLITIFYNNKKKTAKMAVFFQSGAMW